jgi:hypothetical protein
VGDGNKWKDGTSEKAIYIQWLSCGQGVETCNIYVVEYFMGERTI